MKPKKNLTAILLLLMCLPVVCFAQQEISGPQSGTLGPGNYVVVGDIQVESGESLNIVPGTTFLHNGDEPNYKWEIHGAFTAVGTENDSIYFLSQDGVTLYDRWGGLRFMFGAPVAVLDYCVVDNCHLDFDDFYVAGVNVNGGMGLNLTHSRVSNCYGWNISSGVYVINGDVFIDSCQIVGNFVMNYPDGVGIHLENCDDAQILHSVIAYNSGEMPASSCGGGGISCSNSDAYIAYNLIYKNETSLIGGGILAKSCTVTLENNTIIANKCENTYYPDDCYGGGICTVEGGIITGRNNIIYFNTCVNDPEWSGNVTLEFTCTSQELAGTGNIIDDPVFVDTPSCDYHLQQDSPCIDAGDPSSPPDPDGTIADMGALYYNSTPINVPAAPTDVAVIPDAGGELTVQIDWICPTTTFGGAALTDLDEMRVYRDESLVYTDTDPIIGGSGNCTDAPAESGVYLYKIVGFNDEGEGMPVLVYTWVGEDMPNVVENLLLVAQGENGYLIWDNPTTGLHGGAFNEPITGYHIARSDGEIFEVSGLQTDYLDSTIPAPGNYNYTVTPYNVIGDGGSETSNTEWLGEPFSGIIILRLDNNPFMTDLQASIQNFYTGQVVIAYDWNTYPITSEVDALFITTCWPHILSEAEVQPAVNYLDAGGKVYMEGSDTWYQDPPTPLHPYFNINPIADGIGDLETVIGHNFFEGMTWTYSGPNNFIDHIDPIEPAVTIFSNQSPPYNCGVAYDSGTYRTVGSSFELVSIGDINTFDDAVEGILNFFFEGLGIENENNIPNLSTKLGDNYPNPFNPSTTISFSLTTEFTENTEINIYNLKGQKVKTLVNERLLAGEHSVVWNGTNDSGKSVSSGVYFYKLESGKYTSTKKMIMMK